MGRLQCTAAMLLLIFPAASEAQRGRRGTAPPNWDQLTRAEPTLALTRKDVEEVAPIPRLIEKRKDLALSEAQLTGLRELAKANEPRDEPLLARVDSLRKEIRATTGSDDVTRLRRQALATQLREVVATIRANYASDGTAALVQVDEAKRPTAEEILKRQAEEADELFARKLGARPGGSGGPPSGDRRPPGKAGA